MPGEWGSDAHDQTGGADLPITPNPSLRSPTPPDFYVRSSQSPSPLMSIRFAWPIPSPLDLYALRLARPVRGECPPSCATIMPAVPCRLTVGRLTLNQVVGVRIPARQPPRCLCALHGFGSLLLLHDLRCRRARCRNNTPRCAPQPRLIYMLAALANPWCVAR